LKSDRVLLHQRLLNLDATAVDLAAGDETTWGGINDEHRAAPRLKKILRSGSLA
jgi:hypothetical protein